MMIKTTKNQQNETGVGLAGLTILLMVLMVIVISVIGVSRETNRESLVGEVNYITQLERLAGSKGYTVDDKVTYNERLHLETEEGRYLEVMNYLGGVEVSESEFQEIKEIQSKYQKSLKNVNESGKKDYSLLLTVIFAVLSFYALMLLIIFALRY